MEATKVFISYGREDLPAAKHLYHALKRLGCDPWLDKECLLPGTKWGPAIQRAIRECRYFVVLQSHTCVGRKGYINKEISQALEILSEYPESDPYLILLRLDDCTPSHEKLFELQWVDMFPTWDEGMRILSKAFVDDSGVPPVTIEGDSCVPSITKEFTNAHEAVQRELAHEQEPAATVKVVGVGGAGGNTIRRMMEDGLSRVEFIEIGTDDQGLQRSRATTRICVGANATHGLGAGGSPEVGRQAVEEDRERVAATLAGADIVFITAGMGGGTGTGASPVVAELASEQGALTVGIVSTPFIFEGRRRLLRAQKGLAKLRQTVDTLIVVSNERLLQVLPGKTPINEAFREVDNVLRQAVQTITDVVLVPGLINLDFADVRTVMSHRGDATMGVGVGAGKERARRSAQEAIGSPLLEDISICGAKGLLVRITAGPTLSQGDIADVMETINGAAGDDADTYFGVIIDDAVLDDEIRITLIATGLEASSGERKVDTNEGSTASDSTTLPAVGRSDPPLLPPVSSSTNDPRVPDFIRRARRRQ